MEIAFAQSRGRTTMAPWRIRASLLARPPLEKSVESQIDRRIGAVSGSSALRQFEPTSVLVRKAVFADRNPTENYAYCATQQSCEEHDFEDAHREYRQSKGHDRTPLFGAKSLKACRSLSISTVECESRLKLLERLIVVNHEHSHHANAVSLRTPSSDSEVAVSAWSEYVDWCSEWNYRKPLPLPQWLEYRELVKLAN